MTAPDMISKIQAVFKEHEDRPFLIESMTKRTWTYGQFYDWALRAATLLQNNGIGKGDRVALMLANSAEFVALYWGCLFLGAVVVPVNQGLHPKEIKYILSRSAPRLLLFSRCTRALILQATEGLTQLHQIRVSLGQEQSFHPEDIEETWSFEQIQPDPSIRPLNNLLSGDIFTILFTSGTTGTPKGVIQTVGSQFGNALAFNSRMNFSGQNRFLHLWPMSYSSGILNTLISPFMAGSSVVLIPAFTAQTVLTFWKSAMEFKANTTWLAPTMMASLLRMDRDQAGIDYCRRQMKTICVGTAPLPLKLRKDFAQKYGLDVHESYGLSELLILSTNDPAHPVRDNSVGRLLDGVELFTADDSGNRQSPDHEGEIFVRTDYAMLGYLNLETSAIDPLDRTTAFPTGDIGRVDADGYLFITDRKKDLIIRGGQNISPRAIRDVLLSHPSVDDAIVVGLPHDFYGEEVGAALRLKENLQLSDEQSSILEHCRKQLSRNSIPTRLIQLEQFPIGVSGKILNREIRTRF